jgi:hypothetical protein
LPWSTRWSGGASRRSPRWMTCWRAAASSRRTSSGWIPDGTRCGATRDSRRCSASTRSSRDRLSLRSVSGPREAGRRPLDPSRASGSP